jgi:hypothetical protein
MVEQEAVNFEVTGSSPVAGATYRPHVCGVFTWLRCAVFKSETRQIHLAIVTGSAKCSEIKMCFDVWRTYFYEQTEERSETKRCPACPSCWSDRRVAESKHKHIYDTI